MSGHHAGHTPRKPSPADPLLDQLAQHIALARASGNPAIDALAPAQATFTAAVLARLDGLDAATIGAVLLAAGYHAGEYLKTVPPEQAATAAANAVNLLQLAGAQLYTARVPSKAACGLAWPGGKRCKYTAEAADDETLTAVMRGHVALNHPGQEWPATGDDTDGDTQAATPGEYDLTVDEALEALRTDRVPTGARSQPKHAPHEVCNCRPGETYHCAADDTDGEAQG